MKQWRDGPQVNTTFVEHLVSARNLLLDDRFLTPRWPEDLHDPFLLPDMEKGVARLWKAIESSEVIGIVGDYDMDGTPAAVIMAQFLRLVGSNAHVILPTREEGYGFTTRFVDQLREKGVTLIITVDCGIRDNEAVSHALKHGCDVILTDHHECAEVLPPAYAIINPKRLDSTYPFRELCGTALAYKFVDALIQRAPEAYRSRIPGAWLAWTLDLVAMATVGDMMPLIDENRVFVTYGMKVLRKTARPGLQRFFEALAIDPTTLGYSDISFKIIPKFNASGRMESMDDVFTLLVTQDIREADEAVKRVLARGTQSQLLLASMLEQARERVGVTDSPVVLVADDTWHPGLTGLVASRLAEELSRPVGVFAGVDAASYRGSMRSIPGVSLPDLLTQASDLLEKFGGHEQAAGLSFPKSNFDSLQTLLSRVSVQPSMVVSLVTDGLIDADQVTLSALEDLERLAPWGMGHTEPLWSLSGVMLEDVRWLSDGVHLRAAIRGAKGALPVIYFRAESIKPLLDSKLDIYGTLTINEFRGKRTPQFMIKGATLHNG